MATSPTLLCIHRDPARLAVLRENGYELLTAANGREGLRLFRSRPVDAIVLEYNLGLLDGSVIASEIKNVRPTIPIVMVAEHAELPNRALQAVDVLVSTSDPPHFLWAAIHFLLTVKPANDDEGKREGRPPSDRRPTSRSRGEATRNISCLALDDRDAPFSPKLWQSIRTGTVRF
jgi:DNA-binding response OmpR family regulator